MAHGPDDGLLPEYLIDGEPDLDDLEKETERKNALKKEEGYD